MMSTSCSSWQMKLPIRPSTEPAMVNYCSPTDARPSCHRAHGKDVARAVREARARAAAARAVAAREARSAAREARGAGGRGAGEAGGRGAGEAGGRGAGGAGGAGGPVVVAGLRPARRPRPAMRPDWLDGFLARKLNQMSSFGAFLDPVADKFLVCASLLVLVHLQRADVFVALIIIGREIAISALREWMAMIGATKSVAVHMIGKVKTSVQMIAIPFLLYDTVLFGTVDTNLWGTWLIWLSAVLTVWSMVYYLKKAIPEIRARAK